MNFQEVMNLYEKCTAKPYYFLFIDSALVSEWILIMTIDDKIRYENCNGCYYYNREAAKISALSARKIDQCEYLTVEEILTSDQSKIIEQVKFTYSPLGNVFEKKLLNFKEKKQVEALKAVKLEENQ